MISVMPRILIFANPTAGRGRAARLAQELADHLPTEGFEAHLVLQKAESADPATVRGAHAAIVIGGDGTLRGVAAHLIADADAASIEPPPLLLIPMGTANLMGKHLGLRWNRDRIGPDVAAALRADRRRLIDGAMSSAGLCLLIASVGFDAAVVHELARVRTGPISHLSYVVPALRAMAAYAFPPISVWVDGRRVFDEVPGIVAVGNVREYGAGFPLLPEARTDDGLLDVCVMPCDSRMDLVQLALRAVIGEHTRAPGVVYLKGRNVRVESPKEVPVEIDGEPAGTTPVDLALLPRKVAFIVPA